MSVTVGSGNDVIIQIPSKGEEGWADLIRTQCFAILAGHTHAGSGQGQKIDAGSIAANAVRTAAIRLENNQFLRARNAADNADLNLFKVNTSNQLEINIDIAGNVVYLAKVTADQLQTEDLILTPVSADPLSPVEGQLQVSDGTARAAGLWVYQGAAWTSPSVADDSISTAKIQDDAVTLAKLEGDFVDARLITDANFTINLSTTKYRKFIVVSASNDPLFNWSEDRDIAIEVINMVNRTVDVNIYNTVTTGSGSTTTLTAYQKINIFFESSTPSVRKTIAEATDSIIF